MEKHAVYDLVQMQSVPLQGKILMTQRRIREWYEYYDGDVYVAVSGGKDSQVLAHLVKQMYPNVPLVFSNTGLEYGSVRKKGLELADTVLRPKKSFLQIITEYGYPVISKEVSQAIYECQRARINGKELPKYRMEKLLGLKLNKDGTRSAFNMDKYYFLLDAPFLISHLCCYYSKKLPSELYEKETGRKPYLGTMAQESRLRRTKWAANGCNAFELGRPTSQPLSFWTEQDILHYIKQYELEIASVYGDIVPKTKMEGQMSLFDLMENYEGCDLKTTGAKRTGCTFCLFGISQDRDRLVRLKSIEPSTFDYVMRGGRFNEKGLWVPHNGLGYRYVVEWLNEHGNMEILI